MDPANEPQSISEAFDKGLAETEQSDNGSSDEAKSDQADDDDESGKNEDGDVEPIKDDKPDKVDDNGKPIKKEPVIDPDAGKYDGEYTKERFNGLMSAWQKDKAAMNNPEKLKAQLEKLGVKFDQPNKAAEDIKPDEIELPPELQGADEASKEGYKLVMKGLQGSLSKLETKILGKMMDTLNAPLKQENETHSKISAEVDELKISEGKLFESNTKEILKFASENEYPLGTLKQAYRAWKKEQELTGRIKSLTQGKEIVKEIEKDDRKSAEIPKHSKGVAGKLPMFDAKRDGDKSWDDIWGDVKQSLGEE